MGWFTHKPKDEPVPQEPMTEDVVTTIITCAACGTDISYLASSQLFCVGCTSDAHNYVRRDAQYRNARGKYK